MGRVCLGRTTRLTFSSLQIGTGHLVVEQEAEYGLIQAHRFSQQFADDSEPKGSFSSTFLEPSSLSVSVFLSTQNVIGKY